MQKIFRFWELQNQEARILLGLKEHSWRAAEEKKELPARRATGERVSRILWIYRMISEMYPCDEQLAAQWISRKDVRLGQSPLEFVTEKTSLSGSRHALKHVHELLDERFRSWGAARASDHSLMWIDPLLRFKRESGDALATMMIRIADDWALSSEDQLLIFGVPKAALPHVASRAVALHHRSANRMRVVASIDYALWTLFRETLDRSTWMNYENKNPLFGGKSPRELLAYGNLSVLKCVYRHLMNITQH